MFFEIRKPMTTSNELRIGNYYLSFGVNLMQIEKLNKDMILIDFHPVPITEAWLINFGFHKIEGYPYLVFKINGMSHFEQNETNKDEFYLEGLEGESINDVPIKYVHQLQNLYFALTGKELEFKK